ncbi:MAG TPA: hypothetical protein P5275_07630 [Saprospiraceae bacterium]|nr:hypothetical protein [Saprospiraceae bacterium]HPQ99583.1 hypothetical protein [Saprospiraceae bacterium]HQU54756.1 hypothetical protein [Saprospiraceae bacterium]HRV84716.1 hypothetical protein [Saprospiraceae bacterium]
MADTTENKNKFFYWYFMGTVALGIGMIIVYVLMNWLHHNS